MLANEFWTFGMVNLQHMSTPHPENTHEATPKCGNRPSNPREYRLQFLPNNVTSILDPLPDTGKPLADNLKQLNPTRRNFTPHNLPCAQCLGLLFGVQLLYIRHTLLSGVPEVRLCIVDDRGHHLTDWPARRGPTFHVSHDPGDAGLELVDEPVHGIFEFGEDGFVGGGCFGFGVDGRHFSG